MVGSVLRQAGYRTGEFTSPGIPSYADQIRFEGKRLSAAHLMRLIKACQPGINLCLQKQFGHPTEFELLTAAAFYYFYEQDAEIAVVEAGMGGQEDATNVIHPAVAAITSVDLDHQEYLGMTREEIACNKAGIAKEGVSVVCGEEDPHLVSIIARETRRRGGFFYRAGGLVRITNVNNCGLEGFIVDLHWEGHDLEGIKLPLAGSFQLRNLKTAGGILCLLEAKGFRLTDEDIALGLAGVRWPCRLERISSKPEVIIDAAHNPHAAYHLARALEEIYPGRQRVMVLGILDDKDASGIMRELAFNTRCCVVTRPEGPRGTGWYKQFKEARRFIRDVAAVESIEDAVRTGIEMAGQEEYVLITGSFYTIKKARSLFYKS